MTPRKRLSWPLLPLVGALGLASFGCSQPIGANLPWDGAEPQDAAPADGTPGPHSPTIDATAPDAHAGDALPGDGPARNDARPDRSCVAPGGPRVL